VITLDNSGVFTTFSPTKMKIYGVTAPYLHNAIRKLLSVYFVCYVWKYEGCGYNVFHILFLLVYVYNFKCLMGPYFTGQLFTGVSRSKRVFCLSSWGLHKTTFRFLRDPFRTIGIPGVECLLFLVFIYP
jgi:hypothetical protein